LCNTGLGLSDKGTADNIPDLIGPNENITFQEINDWLVSNQQQ